MAGDERKATRYEAGVATFIGVLALMVSAYTAYMQRQQVRAQVWPILEYTTSNQPTLRLSIANKGVGPAIIRNVLVSVDGAPLPEWSDVLQRLMGPGGHRFSFSSAGGRIVSAGETIDILVPRDADGSGLAIGAAGSDGDRLNQGLHRIGIEICYCSALDDCWTLRARPDMARDTYESGHCPPRSERTFQQ